MRLVVVLFGPAGAGKTTIARSSGLAVYDRDDPHWRNRGETQFRAAIRKLAGDPGARAAVIRTGATSTARHRAIADTGATHAYLVETDQATCHQRAGHRRRSDAHPSHAYIDNWFAKFDHDDDVAVWPGSWAQVLAEPAAVPAWTPSRAQVRAPRDRSKAGDPRSTHAWRVLRAQVFTEESHCWWCHTWVNQALPKTHPMSRTVDHLDPIARGGKGVPDRSMVRLAHRRCNGRRGHRTRSPSLTVNINMI